jgi:hypothetical protein
LKLRFRHIPTSSRKGIRQAKKEEGGLAAEVLLCKKYIREIVL